MPEVLARLDALIDEMRTKTGAEQVDLMGHSLGTTVSFNYLATPEHAAKVAHYVNIDGRQAAAAGRRADPGALGGRGEPADAAADRGRDERHPRGSGARAGGDRRRSRSSRCSTSCAAAAPFTTEDLPRDLPRSSPAGWRTSRRTPRLDGAKLDVPGGSTAGPASASFSWTSFDIGPDGSFGPFRVVIGLNFEFAVVRARRGSTSTTSRAVHPRRLRSSG